jgi:hypothetical protein
MTPDAIRQRKSRARRKAGLECFRLYLPKKMIEAAGLMWLCC